MSYTFNNRELHDLGHYVKSRSRHWLSEAQCAIFFDLPSSIIGNIISKYNVPCGSHNGREVVDRFRIEVELVRNDIVGLRHIANMMGLDEPSCEALAEIVQSQALVDNALFRKENGKYVFCGRAFERAVHNAIAVRPKVWSSLSDRTRSVVKFLEKKHKHAEVARDQFNSSEYANSTCSITQLPVSARYAEPLENGKPFSLRPDVVSWAVILRASEDLKNFVRPMLYKDAERRVKAVAGK